MYVFSWLFRYKGMKNDVKSGGFHFKYEVAKFFNMSVDLITIASQFQDEKTF